MPPSRIASVRLVGPRRPAPPATSAGMPRVWARIAVCEVGPPWAVASPMTQAGSSPAVSEGARSGAIRMQGASGRSWPLFRAGAIYASTRAADIAQVRGAGCQHRVAQRRELAGHPLHRRVPGEGDAVALDHELAGQGDQVGVGDQLGLRLEDPGIRRAQPPLGVVGARAQLPVRHGERPLAGGRRRWSAAPARPGRRSRRWRAHGSGRWRCRGSRRWRRSCAARRRRLLAGAETGDRGADPGERAGFVVAAGRDGDRVAAAQAELQQDDQVRAVRDDDAVAERGVGRRLPPHPARRFGRIDAAGPIMGRDRFVDAHENLFTRPVQNDRQKTAGHGRDPLLRLCGCGGRAGR